MVMINRLHVTGLMVVLALAALAQAQTFTTIYTFNGTGGAGPYAGLIQDPDGNLYGTASTGYYDVVYEVNTTGTESVLYRSSRTYPYTPVVRDKAGNLYGTTYEGGSDNCNDYGCGIVYKIDTGGNETTLYSFTGGSDGCNPYQGLLLTTSGALFGTTSGCGSSNFGTI